MTRDDDPTQPLPAAGGPEAQPGAAATEPLVAPHVPVADIGTAEVVTAEPIGAAPPGSGAGRAFIIGMSALAAAVIAVLALSTLPRGSTPAPADTTSPPAVPSPTVSDEIVDDGTDPAPSPPPADPDPEPTVEPTPEPTVEPTPEPTP